MGRNYYRPIRCFIVGFVISNNFFHVIKFIGTGLLIITATLLSGIVIGTLGAGFIIFVFEKVIDSLHLQEAYINNGFGNIFYSRFNSI